MFTRILSGRGLGLIIIFILFLFAVTLSVAGGSGSSKSAEVAIEHKKTGLQDFHLADYEEELLECSGLAAVHMWIGDNIGTDAGSEVRKTLDEDYWLEISHDYLSLAMKASGKIDLTKELRAHIRGLTSEWYRLSETKVSPEDWAKWYEIIDRCETWRPKNSKRSYYTKGRDIIAKQDLDSGIPG